MNDNEFEQWYVENAFDYATNPIGSRDCTLMRKAWKAALAARQPVGQEPRRHDQSAEDRFEQFVQAEIARSPNALRELGEYLARALDEDDFQAANRLLLQIATEHTTPPAPVAVPVDVGSIPVPSLECYSDNDGDTWFESPDDHELVQGLAVGDVFELDVSHYSVTRQYVVTKAPDGESDDYEVAPVVTRSQQVAAKDGNT